MAMTDSKDCSGDGQDERTITIDGKEFTIGDSIVEHKNHDGAPVGDCEELVSGDADPARVGHNALWQTPDGKFVQVYWATEGRQMFADSLNMRPEYETPFRVCQFGNYLGTELLSGLDREVVLEDICKGYLIRNPERFSNTFWSGPVVSVSGGLGHLMYSEATPEVEELQQAGRRDITFRIDLR